MIALSTGLPINCPMWEVGRRQETFGHHKLMGIYYFNLLTSIGFNGLINFRFQNVYS